MIADFKISMLGFNYFKLRKVALLNIELLLMGCGMEAKSTVKIFVPLLCAGLEANSPDCC
jgi:hypothetical protein